MFQSERYARFVDAIVVALAVSLPWSTSATGILAALWLIAIIPTLDVAALRRTLATPAGGIPVLLWVLALVGIPLGLFAGYVGRWVDSALMRLLDVFFAFPTILLGIALVSVFGSSSWVLME